MSSERFHSLLLSLSRSLAAPGPDTIPPYQLLDASSLIVPIVTTDADALPGFRHYALTEAIALATPGPSRQPSLPERLVWRPANITNLDYLQTPDR